jgi:hypothetical protein
MKYIVGKFLILALSPVIRDVLIGLQAKLPPNRVVMTLRISPLMGQEFDDLERMTSSRMLRRVALVRTDVSDEISASIIRVTRIGELGTTLAATSNRRTLILSILKMDPIISSETSVLTRLTRCHILEDGILPVIKLFLLKRTVGLRKIHDDHYNFLVYEMRARQR